jgi:hypothetical protein
LIVIVFERSFNILQEVMTATIAEERLVAERNSETVLTEICSVSVKHRQANKLLGNLGPSSNTETKATIAEERLVAERNSEEGTWAVFQGRNRLRFCIAAWPKIR